MIANSALSVDRAVSCGSLPDRVVSTSNRTSATAVCGYFQASSKTAQSSDRAAILRSPFTSSSKSASRVVLSTRGCRAARKQTQVTSVMNQQKEMTADEKYANAYKKLKVADFMTSPALSTAPEVDVYDAIKLLVEKGISGLPVIDEDGFPVGVVSGFDILALDTTPGHVDRSDGMFPAVGRCEEYGGNRDKMWETHFNNKDLLEKAGASKVEDIMHDPFTIPVEATVEEASNVILKKRLHRLSVVDAEGKLVGVISRGDIVRASLTFMKDILDTSDDE